MAGQDPIEITYKDASGNESAISTAGMFKQLQDAGYPVTGVSADGMEFHFSDPRGEFTMAAPDVMKNLGHEVLYVQPTAPDESKINLGYRAAISRLPDDDARKAYLEAKLKREGIENPQVVGNKRDWSFYDPASNQWHSLTNSKSWDLSDAVEGALEVTHGLGSGMGAIAGAGIGNLPGAMAGGAGGGALAESLIRGGLAAVDPEFKEATSLGAQAKDIGISAGLDAALVGGGAVAGKVLKPLAGASEEGLRRLALTGPVSTAAKGLGKTAGAVGELLGLGGKAVQNPVVREGVKAFTPGLSQAQAASMAMQAPEYLTQAAAKGANYAAKSPVAEAILGPEAAQAARTGAEEILTKEAPVPLADAWNKLWRGTAADAPTVKASNVLSNVGEKASRALGASEEGIKQASNIGAKTGRAMENLATLGRNVDKASDVAVNTLGAGARGVGAATKAAGDALYTAGSVAQPFEAMGAGGAGLREVYGDDLRKYFLQKERKALQNKLNGSKMGSSFANTK